MHAVVFAYHDVGVNCLQALLDAGIQVDLVITHTDDPNENIWFASVVELCKQKNIPYLQPQANELNALLPRLQALQPDYIFSFYYRYLIPTTLLACARIAALNMHGSLLPKYRGRAPINWAIVHGETETGATLHIMESKPDAGDIVGQERVTIGPNDTATAVFARVSAAAVQVIQIVLPQLLRGQLKRLPNRLEQGSYFGGRKPADGKVDWSQTAQSIHNLIRAVAPPYPGAFTTWQGRQMVLASSILLALPPPQLQLGQPGVQMVDNQVFGICGDQQVIEILHWYPA
jgi:methionyl-tRNA formyltransferase